MAFEDCFCKIILFVMFAGVSTANYGNFFLKCPSTSQIVGVATYKLDDKNRNFCILCNLYGASKQVCIETFASTESKSFLFQEFDLVPKNVSLAKDHNKTGICEVVYSFGMKDLKDYISEMYYRSGNCKASEEDQDTLSLECPANSNFSNYERRKFNLRDQGPNIEYIVKQDCVLCNYSKKLNISVCSVPEKLTHTDASMIVNSAKILDSWFCGEIDGTYVAGHVCKKKGNDYYPLCGLKIQRKEKVIKAMFSNPSTHISSCSYKIDADDSCAIWVLSSLTISVASIIALIYMLYDIQKACEKIKFTKENLQNEIPLDSYEYVLN